MRDVYLDHNATTWVTREVLEAMQPFFTELYGNPASLHGKGTIVEQTIQTVKDGLLDFLNARTHDVLFTGGGTEAIALALELLIPKHLECFHILTTRVEHDALLSKIKLIQTQGCIINYLTLDRFGRINTDDLLAQINHHTKLICLMQMQNEIGTLYPVSLLAELVKKKFPNVFIFSDGVQGFGKDPIDLTHIDAYALSGHKIHAPKGIGALIVKKDLLRFLKRHQGTLNVPGIVGLYHAACHAFATLSETKNRLVALKKYFLTGLVTFKDILVNSPEDGFPNTVNVSFLGIHAPVLIHMLESKGIFVSTGAACTSAKAAGSHVLKAINLTSEQIRSAIRFSFSRYTTVEEIDYTLSVLNEQLNHLRLISKFKIKL